MCVEPILAHSFQNESELDRLTQSMNRTAQTLTDLEGLSQLDASARSDGATRYARDGATHHARRQTDQLLNTSHSLSFELQQMERDRHQGELRSVSASHPTY